MPIELVFSRDDDGKIDAVTILQNGTETHSPRVGDYVEPKKISLPGVALERFVGHYALAPNFILSVTLEDGQLMVQATGQQKFPVYPKSDHRFFYEVVSAEIEFDVSPGGRVRGLTLHQNGDQYARKL